MNTIVTKKYDSGKHINLSDSNGIYIKILMNYFQILMAISSFDLKIDTGWASIPNVVAKPIEKTLSSLDCFLLEFYDGIKMIYFRVFYALACPCIYIGIFIIGYVSYCLFKKRKV